MKIFNFIILLSISIYANNILNLPELTERDGLMYQKFSNTPFSGKGKITTNLYSKDCKIMVVDVLNGQMPMVFPIKMEQWNCKGQLLSKAIANADNSFYEEKWNNQGIKISDMKYSIKRKPYNGWKIKNINSKSFKVIYENGQIIQKVEISTQYQK